MVKLRKASYCNLKLFLLYLVVYGHWIEPQIGTSAVVLTQYRWIYYVHMPAFAFLSGLFLRDAGGCLRLLKRCLPIYVVAQLLACLLTGGNTSMATPWWHLWYLLSCSVWAALGWLWFRFGRGKGKLLFLLVAVLLGLLAGEVPWLDRTLSGSRTLVFLPYFWAGLICSADIPWHRYRLWGWLALLLGVGAGLLWGEKIPVTFLYQATGYGRLEQGMVLRLLCYVLGGLLGFFLLTIAPTRRLPFTRAGADTMAGYLLHGPVVRLLREEMTLPWPSCLLLSAGFLWLTYKLLQWVSPAYGIVPLERREGPWLDSRKSMRHTLSRYTDSSCD
ncbi:MAG: hypothetical protein E7459_01675 [Ruminococcaceae bacterium]|nr:hypothetical protein [Oscillospiraceae bacterium]